MTTTGISEPKLLEESLLGPCHKVEAQLGRGGFGVVLKCRNINTNKCVAIKVNKNDPDIYHQARQEIGILKQLRCLDPETSNIVQWNGYFFFEMNICLNFELLDLSLYHYMKDRPEKILPMTEVKDVVYQLTIGLSHLNSIGIVHADIKPENIMVVDRHQKPIRVKLIDFGLASHVSDCQPGMCVQTTWYRAPEVCLYSQFNEAIDMWSLGLTAAEIAVGYPLYPGNTDYDVLSFIIATQGQPPDHVLDQGQATGDYFNPQHDGPQRWKFKTQDKFQYETGIRPSDTRPFCLSSLDDLEELMEVNRGHNSDHGLLVDLIKRMMHLDQDQRIKTQEVLQHPFLTQFAKDLKQNNTASDNMTTTGISEPKLLEESLLGPCHKVEAQLGRGGFGVVLKCRNINTNKCVAIKVNKNDPDIYHQARQEIGILKQLRCLDPETSNIVQWNGYFFFEMNICLNFELLDLSLYHYMKDRPEKILPMTEVKDVVYQLTIGLSHLNSIGIVHADIKPENIMVVDRHQKPIRVKLIDFGLASHVSDCQPGMCVQTTWYRAPEVCLYSQFNEAIDMWSLGLTAAEIAVGYPLYPGNTDYDVLSFIIATQGQPPDHVLDQGQATGDYFNPQHDGPQRWKFKTQDKFQYETGIRPSDTRPFCLSSLDDLEELMEVNRGHNSDHGLLVDLIKRMMHLDQDQRIKTQEVLQHPFLTHFAKDLKQNNTASDNMTTTGISEPKLLEESLLGPCHKVEAQLGRGGFGVVLKCRNINTNKCVAIKVNKNDPDIYHQARQEIGILKQLRCLDLETSNIVQWNGYFFFEMNICLNFELLDLSLYHYMKDRPEKILPMTEVKDVVYQLTIGLSHLNSIGIVHADIKPENIMVVDRHQKPIRVKLIDFGLASHVSDCQPGMCVQTTWYRAPEVCLYSQFNEAIDMWSLGLTAAEIAVGYPLYPGNTDYDVLSFIIATQGQPPDHVLDQGQATGDYFNPQHDGPQRWKFKTQDKFQYETGIRPSDTRPFCLSSLDDLEELMEVNRGHNSDHGLLVDLIKRMMHLDQDQRIKTQEVLQHPFLTHFAKDLKQNNTASDNMTTTGISEPKLLEESLLGPCHKVEAQLGRGGFGVVLKCRNINTNKCVAIKVNKNDPDIYHQARQEIGILKQLRCLDPETSNIVQWNGYFFFETNICLNFELLDLSLYHYMKDRPEKILPMTEVKDVVYQLTIGLSHLNSIGIVHADIKPENIMVVDRHQKPIRVKLIDFGLASHVSDCQPGMCVQTIWYRAPEVCLYSKFNEAIDMWSLGLTAAEIAVGYPLYPGNMDYDVLSFIIATQGQPPDHVLDQGRATPYYFNPQHDGPQRWKFKTQDEFQYETGIRPSDTRPFCLSSLDHLEHLMEVNRGHNSDHGLLVDLIKRMMHLDQDQRIKIQEVLQHPFLTCSLPQNSHADVCNDVRNTEEAVPETNLPPSPTEFRIDMADIEEVISEESQQPSCPEVCIDMTDIEEATCCFHRGNTSQFAESEIVGWFSRVI